MQVAEALYQRGILSYPRTETDFFKEGFDLNTLLVDHRQHSQWGAFTTNLLDNNAYCPPRKGLKDDQAHPPIHPTKCVELNQLDNDDEKRVYELVTRHFLACCAHDARGSQTKLSICIPQNGGESFSATGLMVTERNWLEVYKYEYWSASKVPVLRVGDTLMPKKLIMCEGRTTPPGELLW
jgi:DNA topoisomerase-3